MKRSRFTDSQIIDSVKRVEAGMGVSMMSRMKELEDENRRLKKMYLEEKLKAEIVAEALEKKW